MSLSLCVVPGLKPLVKRPLILFPRNYFDRTGDQMRNVFGAVAFVAGFYLAHYLTHYLAHGALI